jgi:hypothetical protein
MIFFDNGVNSVEIYRDAICRCRRYSSWRTDDVRKIVVLGRRRRIGRLYSDAGSGVRKRGGTSEFGDKSPTRVLRHSVVWRVHDCCTLDYGRVTPPLHGGHPNNTRRLQSRAPATSGTVVDDDAAATTPIAVMGIVTDLRRELDI